MEIRVIPCLLLKNNGLVKTVRFNKTRYIGDPINAVKILNEKEVDELIFLDIEATISNKEINYHIIENIASECFMPFCYGGGIRNVDQMRKIFNSGAEKVAINTESILNQNLISEAAKIFGSQSIIAAIDIKKGRFGNRYYIYC